MAIGGFFTAGFKLVNAIIKYRRKTAMKKSIEVLAISHFKLRNSFVDLKNDFLTVVDFTL